MGSATRFQARNICDCMLYDRQLFLLELKSTKGKSIPFSNFRDKQIEDLVEASEFGIKAGVLIEFSDIKEVYYLDIATLADYIATADRKSVPIAFMQEKGVQASVRLLQVNIRIDVDKLIEDIKEGS